MFLHVRVFFAWYDFWIGVYVDVKRKSIFLCPIPCCGLQLHWGRKFWEQHGDSWKRECGHISLVRCTDHVTKNRFWIIYTNGTAYTEGEGFTPKFSKMWKAMEYADLQFPMEEGLTYPDST